MNQRGKTSGERGREGGRRERRKKKKQTGKEGSEKAMAPHSSTLAWKIPWMEKSGGLQSMGSWRVGPLRPLRGLPETRVATREEGGVLSFPSSRGLTPRGSLECNPDIPAFPGEEY